MNFTVPLTSKGHYNQIGSTRKEVVLVKKKCYKRISSLKLWIPEKLDLDLIIRNNPPDFAYKKDKFIFIISLINSIPANNKKVEKKHNGYTPISKTILGRQIKDYRVHINYLKQHNIVEEDKYAENKCSGLKVSKAYYGKLKPVLITEWTLIKNIVYLSKKEDSDKTVDLLFMKKWFSGLTIDIKSAEKLLEVELKNELKNKKIKNPILKFNSRTITINNLNDNLSNPQFSVDNTSGRLHTHLTQVKSELRPFIRYKKEVLYSIDLVNSQPFLVTSVLNYNKFKINKMGDRIIGKGRVNIDEIEDYIIMLGVLIKSIENEEDVLIFKRIVESGRFYEEFGKLLLEHGLIENKDSELLRKEVKKITFLAFFSKNSLEKYDPKIQVFVKCFPNVFKVFKALKNKNHPCFAIILQNLEAELILHKICNCINAVNPGIPLFTIHDSVITTHEHVEFVSKIMRKTLKKNIGVEPKLDIKPWI